MNVIKPTADETFKRILTDHGSEKCWSCGRELDRGDVAWNNASTEAGTPFAVLEIICQACDSEVMRCQTWWPAIDDFEEFVEVLERFQNDYHASWYESEDEA